MSKKRFKTSSKKPKIKVSTTQKPKTEEEVLEQELQDLVEGIPVTRVRVQSKTSALDDPEWETVEAGPAPTTPEEAEQRLDELLQGAQSVISETKQLLEKQEREEIAFDVEEIQLLNSQAKEEHQQKVAELQEKSTQLFTKRVEELRQKAQEERVTKTAQLEGSESESVKRVVEEKANSVKELKKQIAALKEKGGEGLEEKIEELKRKEVKELAQRIGKLNSESIFNKNKMTLDISLINQRLDTQITELGMKINSATRQIRSRLDEELEQTLKKNDRRIQESQERLSSLDGWDVIEVGSSKGVSVDTEQEVGSSKGVSVDTEQEVGSSKGVSFATEPEVGSSKGVSVATEPEVVASSTISGSQKEYKVSPSSYEAKSMDDPLITKLQSSKDYKEAIRHWNDSMQDPEKQKKSYIIQSEKVENGIHTVVWVDPNLTEEQRKNPDFHVIYRMDQRTGALSSIESGCNVVCSIPPMPRDGGGFDVINISKGKVSLPIQRDGGVSSLSIKAHSKSFDIRLQQSKQKVTSPSEPSERKQAQKEADKYADYGISLMVESPGAGPRISDMASKLAEAYGADKKDMEARILSNVEKLKAALEKSKLSSKSTGTPSSPPHSPPVSGLGSGKSQSQGM